MAESPTTTHPYWWLGIIQGILLIFIGWFLLTTPVVTTITLITILGLYWLIAGAVDVVMAVFNKTGEKSRGWELASGLLGIIVGLIIINNPVVSTVFTVSFLVYLIAFAFIFNGAIKVFLGSSSNPDGKLKWSWGGLVLGILYILLGLMVLAGPMITSAAVLVWALALVIMVGGVMAIVASFTLRKA